VVRRGEEVRGGGGPMGKGEWEWEGRRQGWGRYQVMTLSDIGEADIPAGGSVCIRWNFVSPFLQVFSLGVWCGSTTCLEIAHEPSSGGGRHDVCGVW
jgi:hypothetical protein